jgi:hypothetical protein
LDVPPLIAQPPPDPPAGHAPASPPQATHVRSVEHTFEGSLQSALATHATQVPSSGLHAGLPLGHAAALVGEQRAHEPAVAPDIRHAPPLRLPVHSPSLVQPRHVASCPHTGRGFEQLSLAVHPTQACFMGSQYIVGEAHCVASLH